MKNTYIIVIVLVVAGGLFFVLNSKKLEAPIVNNPEINIAQATTGQKEFTITSQNFSFSPSSITVKKGDRVKITFKNANGFHDFKIDEFGVGAQRSEAPAQEILEFTADKTGSFEYYCSVGTHRMLGMKGTLVVIK